MGINWRGGVWDCTWFAFKIKGANDKQGFTMKNCVFANHIDRVLLKSVTSV